MEKVYDIVVIGSGAAGLTAAAVAASKGLKVLVVEQQSTLGGTTMLSGGNIWIPNNPASRRVGDTEASAAQCLNSAVGQGSGCQAGSTGALRATYVKHSSRMLSYLCEQGCKWMRSRFPDYQPGLSGALPMGGRTLNPDVFDVETLGSWKKHLEIPLLPSKVLKFEDLREFTKLSQNNDSPDSSEDHDRSHTNDTLVPMGSSLVAQLLDICRRSGDVETWTETKFVHFWFGEGSGRGGGERIIGVEVEKRGEGKGEKVRAAAVFLAAGGFSRNQRTRDRYLQGPTDASWTLTRLGGDTGQVLEEAMAIGAKTSLLHETWGMPVMRDPITGAMVPAFFEISKPHCIVVDRRGHRFCNEAMPYGDYVHSAYEKNAEHRIPAWLIMDSNYLQKYSLGSLRLSSSIERAVNDNRLVRADSLLSLAEQLGLPPSGLCGTVKRWNDMCQNGNDVDFKRGQDAYQKFIGDQSTVPNPNMGTIDDPPFYAVEILPGDVGNKGGVVTDENGRFLNTSSAVIEGLYAAGNISASPFDETSIGAGTTIGPAMTFAYLAVEHICGGITR